MASEQASSHNSQHKNDYRKNRDEESAVLFFVALIPVFTKLVIENNASTITIFAYNIVFLLANVSFFVLANEAKKQITEEQWKELSAARGNYHQHSYMRVIVGGVILCGLAALSILFTKLSVILYMAFPIVFAL